KPSSSASSMASGPASARSSSSWSRDWGRSVSAEVMGAVRASIKFVGADHTRLARIVQQALERSVTGLRRSFLRCVVDMHQTEALVVAFSPFVIVQQRPGEIAADVCSGLPGGEDGLEVILIVFHAARIIVALDLGHAVLGDVDGDLRIVARDAG